MQRCREIRSQWQMQLKPTAHSKRQVHLDNFSWLSRPCWVEAKFWIRLQKCLKLMPSPSFTPICFSTSPKLSDQRKRERERETHQCSCILSKCNPFYKGFLLLLQKTGTLSPSCGLSVWLRYKYSQESFQFLERFFNSFNSYSANSNTVSTTNANFQLESLKIIKLLNLATLT